MMHYCAVGSKYILERSNTLIARSKFQHMQGGPQGLVCCATTTLCVPRRTGPRVSSIGPVVHLDFGGFPEVSCWLESWWCGGGDQSQESELNPELWTSPPPLPARLKDSRLDPESTARTAGREPERHTDNAADTLLVAAAGFPSPADRPSCEPRPGQSVAHRVEC
jgi:hypothetical protein